MNIIKLLLSWDNRKQKSLMSFQNEALWNIPKKAPDTQTSLIDMLIKNHPRLTAYWKSFSCECLVTSFL